MHKNYSRSFIKLRLNPCCHMDYFTDLLATFLDLGTVQLCCCLWEGQRALRFHQKYLNLCSEDERMSYGFETTWGWVINDINFIFGWTIPLNTFFLQYQFFFIDPWTWQIWCHQPISCHGFSAATEDELNWRSGLDIRVTTIRKAKLSR